MNISKIHASINKQTISDSDANNTIIEFLNSKKPCMVARFGAVEIKAIIYPNLPFFLKKPLSGFIFKNMERNAGFFPTSEENIERFSKTMIEDMALLDILASWRIEEFFLKKNYPGAETISLKALEPYFFDNPWTQALQGKKVLVIHPFNKTIEKQYHEKRSVLFSNQKVLPEFKSLETIKAVQTIAGNRFSFANWFEALDSMKSQINQKDFDVAIIGCGAYGFPLAAHVKKIGKQAIHLGGPTQMLFGIKGKRWVENPDFQQIINQNFIFPSNDDKPENANLVEGGCYW